MFYSHLSTLENEFGKETVIKLNQYLSGLSMAQLQSITVFKIMAALNTDKNTATRILMACVDIKFMELQYILCCPECGFKVKKYASLNELPTGDIQCYSCESEFDASPENIEVQFRLTTLPDFDLGQQASPASPVAPINSLQTIFEAGAGLNSILFHLSDERYDELLTMCKNVQKKQATTKATGDTLETLMIELINSCSVLEARGLKTSTNQLDGFARNKAFIPYGVLSQIGLHFVVECKNESTTPSGSYMSKIHSIIEVINGAKKVVTFGIIASKVAAPKTYRILANKYYLLHKITIISISLREIETMLVEKGNFLDLIERKIIEIHLDSTSDLKGNGLYDS